MERRFGKGMMALKTLLGQVALSDLGYIAEVNPRACQPGQWPGVSAVRFDAVTGLVKRQQGVPIQGFQSRQALLHLRNLLTADELLKRRDTERRYSSSTAAMA